MRKNMEGKDFKLCREYFQVHCTTEQKAWLLYIARTNGCGKMIGKYAKEVLCKEMPVNNFSKEEEVYQWKRELEEKVLKSRYGKNKTKGDIKPPL